MQHTLYKTLYICFVICYCAEKVFQNIGAKLYCNARFLNFMNQNESKKTFKLVKSFVMYYLSVLYLPYFRINKLK
uniref:Uncharacterized protein n=1 Tax=Isometrus maculatus TaxID=497827 RepID=A0A0U1SKF1_ISOMC|nr:hypothetical protein [Isometrus maculatus]